MVCGIVILCVCLFPVIDSRVCNLKDYHAPFNDREKDTAAVKRAIADCPNGIIRFPKGRYFLKPFNFSSGQTLFLDNGAYLLASPDKEDWPIIEPFPSYKSGKEMKGPQYSGFISAWNANNVTITGEGQGVIDGNGIVWWLRKYHKILEHTRGRLVEFLYCNNVTVSNINLRYSPFWTLHFYDSNQVSVHDINIMNSLSPNTDGIDIDSTSNVWISRVRITTMDDHISIKSGEGEHGRSYGKPSQNIVVEDSIFEMGSGVAIGTEVAGGVRNVTVRNCEFSLVVNVVRLKGKPDTGGIVEDIVYENLYAGIAYIGFFLDLQYKKGPPVFYPKYRNILVRNINGYTLRKGMLRCLKDFPCENFTVENYSPTSLSGIKCNYVKDSTGKIPTWCN